MRIRKHFLQSLSAATPPPSSDPHGGDRHPLPLVQQQQVHPPGNPRLPRDDTHLLPSDPPPNHSHHAPPPSSDHTTKIGLQPCTWVPSGAGYQAKDPMVFPPKEQDDETKREIIKSNGSTSRKEDIFCAEADSSSSIISLHKPPPTADLILRGWLEGDRLIPIKKRRGSFGKRVNHDLEEDGGMMEEIMKPKRNDKCVVMKEMSATSMKKNKKNVNGKRGNVILEGSRCSRVNGRGWRCCQQTLVGYSLCEHHLGKGRLRSITSVRSRAQMVAPKERERRDKEAEKILSDHRENEDNDDEDDEEFNEWEEQSISMDDSNMICKTKKKKLGVVKARSLSSLLSQIGS